jgi:membrane-associated HD superfamily phosphohydrolase
MTEDDWKALSAFERVVDSVSLLRTTLMLGMMALLVNVIVWLAWLPESSKRPLLVQLMPITLAVLCVCFIAIFFGNRTLLRIQRNAPALLLPWLALAVAIVAGGITIMNVQAILDLSASWPFALWYLAAVPLNGFVALHSSRSMWCVSQSLEGISPPEISHRLIEALRYLA